VEKNDTRRAQNSNEKTKNKNQKSKIKNQKSSEIKHQQATVSKKNIDQILKPEFVRCKTLELNVTAHLWLCGLSPIYFPKVRPASVCDDPRRIFWVQGTQRVVVAPPPHSPLGCLAQPGSSWSSPGACFAEPGPGPTTWAGAGRDLNQPPPSRANDMGGGEENAQAERNGWECSAKDSSSPLLTGPSWTGRKILCVFGF